MKVDVKYVLAVNIEGETDILYSNDPKQLIGEYNVRAEYLHDFEVNFDFKIMDLDNGDSTYWRMIQNEGKSSEYESDELKELRKLEVVAERERMEKVREKRRSAMSERLKQLSKEGENTDGKT